MKLVIGLGLLVGGAVGASAPAEQRASPAGSAQEELREGGRAYRAGQFGEAEQHYRNAVRLDASLTTARLLLGRSIRAQYRPDDLSPANVAKAREAIAVYQQALQKDQNLDEAYSALLALHAALKEEAQQRALIERRAGSERLSKSKRAAAYRALAEIDLKCARSPESAQAGAAAQCAERGVNEIAKAIALEEDESAWSSKAQLLTELAKLSQGRNPSSAERYRKEAAQAEARARALAERTREKMEKLPTY